VRLSTIDPEDSVSFAVGDELRRAALRPWRLPVLPFSLIKRLNGRSSATEGFDPVDALVVLDSEMIRSKDLRGILASIRQCFTSYALLAIGNVDGLHVDLSMPRRQGNAESEPWNKLLCNSILHLVRERTPKQLVYVGKFPHAGVRRAIKRIHPVGACVWLSVRGEASAVAAHGSSFAEVAELDVTSGQDHPTVWVDPAVKLTKSPRGTTADKTAADLLVLGAWTDDAVCTYLREGRRIFLIGEGEGPDLSGLKRIETSHFVRFREPPSDLVATINSMTRLMRMQGHDATVRAASRALLHLNRT